MRIKVLFVIFLCIGVSFSLFFLFKKKNNSQNNFLQISNDYPKISFISDVSDYEISIKDVTLLTGWFEKIGYLGNSTDLAVLSAFADQPDKWVNPEIITIHFTDRPQISTHVYGLLPNGQEGLTFSLSNEYYEDNRELRIFVQTPFLDKKSLQTTNYEMERAAEINLLTAIHTLVWYGPKETENQRTIEFNKLLEDYSSNNPSGSLFLKFE